MALRLFIEKPLRILINHRIILWFNSSKYIYIYMHEILMQNVNSQHPLLIRYVSHFSVKKTCYRYLFTFSSNLFSFRKSLCIAGFMAFRTVQYYGYDKKNHYKSNYSPWIKQLNHHRFIRIIFFSIKILQ